VCLSDALHDCQAEADTYMVAYAFGAALMLATLAKNVILGPCRDSQIDRIAISLLTSRRFRGGHGLESEWTVTRSLVPDPKHDLPRDAPARLGLERLAHVGEVEYLPHHGT